jgi:hypothetical protein
MHYPAQFAVHDLEHVNDGNGQVGNQAHVLIHWEQIMHVFNGVEHVAEFGDVHNGGRDPQQEHGDDHKEGWGHDQSLEIKRLKGTINVILCSLIHRV